ncbi:uncharacterized protein LOC109537611 isoform X2 [Dendroctonus ponderosae]|uniref:XK-related protein n=1 Tax=Dendroctonus ponderosae TaxID=77166 RepID=U4TVV1_DENPD|nr:uncharacterized protein LOC109537611 isoform X2 [Dendroctonus ponderosae]ERL84897.1 hypothetical protein D910_02320 [Dendroctonus ponderosae]
MSQNSQNSKTVFGFGLSSHQNALLNHLFPSILAPFLFMLIVATDIGVIFRHYKDGDPIWASLTLFCMFLPAMGSLIITLTDWDYWPEPENGMTSDNSYWLYKKIIGHVFFPVWNVFRHAERIFWSIEAVRSTDETAIEENIAKATEPRLVELYVFLQAYLHSLPQVLLQLHILMRHNSDIAKESKITQAVSILLNLAKVAVTTTFYQRFRAQKLTGSHYPWLKARKQMRSQGFTGKGPDEEVILRSSSSTQRRVIERGSRRTNDDITRLYDIQPAIQAERRRSSDIYLEPEPSPGTVTDTFEETLQTSTTWKRNTLTSRTSTYIARFSSLLGVRSVSSVPDSALYNISRVTYIKGLREDDAAGKLISFLWWFTFLLSRVLAVSVFAYFYPRTCVGLLIAHVLIVIAALAYDVKEDSVKRDKSAFFIFIGLVYIFCIIEFKIRFKKTKFIYAAYFSLMFLENLVMCLMWYCGEIESLENDYWYRYIFYTVIGAHFLTLSSMMFYYILTKPKSVAVRVS